MPPAPGARLSMILLLYAGVSTSVEPTPAWHDEQAYRLTPPSLVQFAPGSTERAPGGASPEFVTWCRLLCRTLAGGMGS
jgi:hypothetical protein